MTREESQTFATFADFWPYYIAAHSKPATRLLHYLGTLSLLPLIILSFTYTPWWLLLYPVLDYACAWSGHFLIEHNKPATFGHPFWSALADFKMFWYMLTGRIKEEVERCVSTSSR